MQTTLQDLLALPAFAGVEVLCGQGQLGQPVTWVHISEVPDAARFLTGGELLLSTGSMLAQMPQAEQGPYLRSLAQGGASGLLLELVRHFQEAPRPLVAAAQELNFPLLVSCREVSFADLTRAAHARLLAGQSVPLESSLEPLLAALQETGRAEMFIQAHLGPLLTLPLRPRATLLATLDALLGTNFNVAEAARKLGVRRQTMYYRMEQLSAMLGDVQDTKKQLGLRLALELMHGQGQ